MFGTSFGFDQNPDPDPAIAYTQRVKPLKNAPVNRSIRAEIIRFLIVDPDVTKKAHPRGIHCRDAKIFRYLKRNPFERYRDDLCLDFDSINISVSIYFKYCYIESGVQIRDSDVRLIAFCDCYVGEVVIARTTVSDSIWLQGSKFERPVAIFNNRIKFDLDLNRIKVRVEYACVGFSIFTDYQPLEITNKINKKRGKPRIPIYCKDNIVDGTLWFKDVNVAIYIAGAGYQTFLDIITFENTRANTFADNENSYKLNEKVIYPPKLDSFEYINLPEAVEFPDGQSWRVERWLGAQTSSLSKFDNLANLYARIGQESNRVAIAKARERKIWTEASGAKNVIGLFYKLSSAYGYSLIQAICVWSLIWLCSATAFSFLYKESSIVPVNPAIFEKVLARKNQGLAINSKWADCSRRQWKSTCDSKPLEAYLQFDALVFAFEVMVPIVDLGQRNAWKVDLSNISSWPLWTLSMLILSLLRLFGILASVSVFACFASYFVRRIGG